MFSFSIEETLLKEFMNKLLKEDAFDFFIVRSVEIVSFARFEITSLPFREADSDKEPENKTGDYSAWKDIKPHVFNIIKGNKRPKSMKIVLSLPADMVNQMHPNAAAYFLNIYFESETTLCTASSSEKVFSMDKTLEVKWEEYIKGFMKQIGIAI